MSRRLIYTLFVVISLMTVGGEQSSQLGSRNVRAAGFRPYEKKIVDVILQPGRYDRRDRAQIYNVTNSKFSDDPTAVHVHMDLLSISKIDDVNMEYSVQMTLTQEWKDDRLQYDDFGGLVKYLKQADPDSLWKPDVFFPNEKEAHFHNTVKPNALVRIYSSGVVLYSIRISLVLSCNMDLRNFPFDVQTCFIDMASYRDTIDDVVFSWKEDDAVTVDKNSNLTGFTLAAYHNDYCTSKTSLGESSCLRVVLKLKRKAEGYLNSIYFPSNMIILASYFSFFLDPSAIAVRLSLCVACLLTMVIQFAVISASLPLTSYLKAVDVWMTLCLMFVFSPLIHFLILTQARIDYQKRLQKKRKQDVEKSAALESGRLHEVACGKEALVQDAELNTAAMTRVERILHKLKKAKGVFVARCLQEKHPRQIDLELKMACLVSFLVFMIIYWFKFVSSYEKD